MPRACALARGGGRSGHFERAGVGARFVAVERAERAGKDRETLTNTGWCGVFRVGCLSRPLRVWLLLPVLAMLTMAPDLPPDDLGFCPPNRSCLGCGCAGGPGYRGPNGRCVGFRELERIGGGPPTERRTFENAPGTGEHTECALRRRGNQTHHPIANPSGSGATSPLAPAKRDVTD
jgi:hypothetical protein